MKDAGWPLRALRVLSITNPRAPELGGLFALWVASSTVAAFGGWASASLSALPHALTLNVGMT